MVVSQIGMFGIGAAKAAVGGAVASAASSVASEAKKL